ncbi:hypothetical protein BC828DRAFT_417047 [Blastocladiella britannica]|nr:hypothetical protein BC828DRAFT_417047 [Blastocladiella britannica]
MSNSDTNFPDLHKHTTVAAYTDLMARICRAEKFGLPIADADKTLYRAFKFDTYVAAPTSSTKAAAATAVPKAKDAAKAAASKKSGAKSTTTPTPAATATTAPTKRDRVIKAAPPTPISIDALSDELKLDKLRRAKKWGLDSGDEYKRLQAWHKRKHGHAFGEDPAALAAALVSPSSASSPATAPAQ